MSDGAADGGTGGKCAGGGGVAALERVPVLRSGPPAFLTQGWGSTYQAWQQPAQQVPGECPRGGGLRAPPPPPLAGLKGLVHLKWSHSNSANRLGLSLHRGVGGLLGLGSFHAPRSQAGPGGWFFPGPPSETFPICSVFLRLWAGRACGPLGGVARWALRPSPCALGSSPGLPGALPVPSFAWTVTVFPSPKTVSTILERAPPVSRTSGRPVLESQLC